uniref:Ribosomal protein S18 n=1 Tax=Crouania attenuata TaxID=42002 RepID=A0A4D6WQ83_9FLOR|nr:ribosomal protein S18 [Crouania attenuata]
MYNSNNLTIKSNNIPDYKDIDLLRKFINEQGKILPKRSNNLSVKQQKQIAKAIKRARVLGLIPFLSNT